MRKRLFEMARKKIERSIPKEVQQRARTSLFHASKANDFEGENISVPRCDSEEMLQRYIFGLIVKGKPCPMSDADIDEYRTMRKIGHYLRDEYGISFEDMQKLYSENSTEQPMSLVKKGEVSIKSIPSDNPKISADNLTKQDFSLEDFDVKYTDAWVNRLNLMTDKNGNIVVVADRTDVTNASQYQEVLVADSLYDIFRQFHVLVRADENDEDVEWDIVDNSRKYYTHPTKASKLMPLYLLKWSRLISSTERRNLYRQSLEFSKQNKYVL